MNISLDKHTCINLNRLKEYYVIDAVYIQDIKASNCTSNSDLLAWETEIRKIAFPYSDIPFATIKAQNATFCMDCIQYVSYDYDIVYNNHYFCADTGLILFIQKEMMQVFIDIFDYDELVDSMTDINEKYWGKIETLFEINQIGLVYMDSGSGTLHII